MKLMAFLYVQKAASRKSKRFKYSFVYDDDDDDDAVTDSRPSLHRVPSDYDFPPPPVSQLHRTHRPARRYVVMPSMLPCV